MKLAFISDIHGNATALDAVLKNIKERDVDQIFVLGDISYRGPEPQRSIDVIRSLDADVIKGNADEWVVRGVRDGEVPDSVNEMMNQERDWIVSNLNEESIDYLKNLPTELNLQLDAINIHAFHATPISLFDMVQPNEPDDTLKEKLMTNEADVFVYAHIHKPFVRYIEGKCIINTGSVGLPFDGLNKAAYALVDIEGDNIEASIVRTSYEVNKVMKQFQESDYPNKELMVKILESASV